MILAVLFCVFGLAFAQSSLNSFDAPLEQREAESVESGYLGLSSGATRVVPNIRTDFSCLGRAYGYFADMGNKCKIYHICQPSQSAKGAPTYYHYSYFCPENTYFDQQKLTCLDIKNPTITPCSESASYYPTTEARLAELPKPVELRKQMMFEQRPIELPQSFLGFEQKPSGEMISTPIRPIIIPSAPYQFEQRPLGQEIISTGIPSAIIPTTNTQLGCTQYSICQRPTGLRSSPEVQPKEAPVQLQQAPVQLQQAPVQLQQAPVQLQQAPVQLQQAPVQLQQAPVMQSFRSFLVNQQPIVGTPQVSSQSFLRSNQPWSQPINVVQGVQQPVGGAEQSVRTLPVNQLFSVQSNIPQPVLGPTLRLDNPVNVVRPAQNIPSENIELDNVPMVPLANLPARSEAAAAPDSEFIPASNTQVVQNPSLLGRKSLRSNMNTELNEQRPYFTQYPKKIPNFNIRPTN